MSDWFCQFITGRVEQSQPTRQENSLNTQKRSWNAQRNLPETTISFATLLDKEMEKRKEIK